MADGGNGNGGPIRDPNNGRPDLTAIVAAIQGLATDSRSVINLLNVVNTNLSSMNTHVTKSDIDALLKDYVKDGFSVLERKLDNIRTLGGTGGSGSGRNSNDSSIRRNNTEEIRNSSRIISEFNQLVRSSNSSLGNLRRDLTGLNSLITATIDAEKRRLGGTNDYLNNLGNFNTNFTRHLTDLINNLQGNNTVIAQQLSTTRTNLQNYSNEINTANRRLQSASSVLETDASTIAAQQQRLATIEGTIAVNRLQQQSLENARQAGTISEAYYQFELSRLTNDRNTAEAERRIQQANLDILRTTETQHRLDAEAEERNLQELYRRIQTEAEIGRSFEEIASNAEQQSSSIIEMTRSITETSSSLRDATAELRENARGPGSLLETIGDSLREAFDIQPSVDESLLRQYDSLLHQYDSALGDIQRNQASVQAMQQANEQRLAEIRGTRDANGNLVNSERADIQNTIQQLEIQRNATASGSDERKRLEQELENAKRDLERINAEEKLLEQQQINLKDEEDNLKAEAENLDNDKKKIQEERNQVAKGTGVIAQIVGKLVSFIGDLVKKAIDTEEEHIKAAADNVFDSFEDLQKSIAKSLKLSSGAYDDLKEQMIQAANEVGVAVDVTQLNDAAASMAELGIRDTEILKNFAIGANILSESGSNLQLDEDISRQLLAGYNQTYNKSIEAGMSNEDATKAASDELINTFYELAAAESAIAEEFGSVSALSRGGYQTIAGWFNQLQEGGYLESSDLGEFTLSMGRYLQAMEKAGVDSSTLLSDFDTIMTGTMSSLNTELQGWFQGSSLQTTEDFIQAISTNFGDVASSFEQYRAGLYESMDEMSVSYAKNAYNSNLTNMNIMGRLDKIDDITKYYEGASRDDRALVTSVESIKNGLDQGSWLTATERLGKLNTQLVDDIAAEAQNLPDGKVIMDEGFSSVIDGMDGIIDAIGAGVGAVITAMLHGRLTTGNLGGLLGNFGNFLIGKDGTAAGTAGKITGATAGVAVAGVNVVQNIVDEGSISAGIETSLTDPNVYSGIGMALGGAIGGPIGAAVGGAIGYASSTLGNKIADIIVPKLAVDKTAEAQLKAAEELQKATENLNLAALNHQNVASTMQTDLNSQQEAFNTFTDNEKANWLAKNEQFLKDNNLIDKQHKISIEDGKNNKLFQDATTKWIEYIQKQIDAETALGESDKFVEDLNIVQDTSSGLTISENEVRNASMSDSAENIRVRQAYAERLLNQVNADTSGKYQQLVEASGVDLEDLQTLVETGYGNLSSNLTAFRNAYNSVQEYISDSSAIMNSPDLTSKLDTITKWASANNELTDDGEFVNFTESAKEYLLALKDIEGNSLFTKEQAEQQAEYYAMAKEQQDNVTAVQKQIQTAWRNAVRDKEKFSDSASYEDILNRLQEWDKELPSNYKDYIDSSSENYESWSKTLAQTATTDTDKSLPFITDISDVQVTNKHATGLAYVPYDEYPALLHEGEMVLNKTDADEYRNAFNSLLNTTILPNDTESVTDNNITDNIIDVIDIVTTQYNNTEKKLSDIFNNVTSFSESLLSSTLNNSESNNINYDDVLSQYDDASIQYEDIVLQYEKLTSTLTDTINVNNNNNSENINLDNILSQITDIESNNSTDSEHYLASNNIENTNLTDQIVSIRDNMLDSIYNQMTNIKEDTSNNISNQLTDVAENILNINHGQILGIRDDILNNVSDEILNNTNDVPNIEQPNYIINNSIFNDVNKPIESNMNELDTDLLTKQYNDIIANQEKESTPINVVNISDNYENILDGLNNYKNIINDVITDDTNTVTESTVPIDISDISDSYSSMLQEIMNNISNADVATAETYGAINNTNNTNISNNFDVSPITESVNNQTNSVTDILNKILQLLIGITSYRPSNLPRSLIQYDTNLNRL